MKLTEIVVLFLFMSRSAVYAIVQRCAMRVWDNGTQLCGELKADEDASKHLTPEEIDKCFKLEPLLKNVDMIFDRVGL